MIIDAKGRFVLHDKPPAYPFIEVVTNTADGPVFDLSVDLEFYSGVVYLKAEHVEEMAKTLGMVTKEEADKLRAQITDLEEDTTRLPRNVERLISGINSSIVDFGSGSIPPVISVPDYLKDPEPESGKGEGKLPAAAKAGAGKPADGTDSSSGKDSKPSGDKGSHELSAGSDDGFDF